MKRDFDKVLEAGEKHLNHKYTLTTADIDKLLKIPLPVEMMFSAFTYGYEMGRRATLQEQKQKQS